MRTVLRKAPYLAPGAVKRETCLRVEEQVACEQLEDHAAERPDVDSAVVTGPQEHLLHAHWPLPPHARASLCTLLSLSCKSLCACMWTISRRRRCIEHREHASVRT